MQTIEWHERRKRGIGGSDIAAIAGLSPWRTPAQVWLEKVYDQKAPRTADEIERMEWGNILEEPIAKRVSEQLNAKIRRDNRHYSKGVLCGNIDRILYHPVYGKGILEIKTSSDFNKSKWANEGVPMYYQLQVQQYMYLTGLKYTIVACLFGGNKLEIFEPIKSDPEAHNWIIQTAETFWHFVETKTPPPLDYQADTSVIEALYPQSEAGKMTDLPIEALELCMTYDEAKSGALNADNIKKETANKLKEMLQDAEYAVVGDYQVSWKSRIDGKRVFNLKRVN